MAHTLTFSGFDSAVSYVTVNGESASSPYTLNNGDVIVARYVSWTGKTEIAVNAYHEYIGTGNQIDLSDVDIRLWATTNPNGPNMTEVTVNYSESSSEPVFNIVDITSLESALTASADAIREKSESTELIDFDMEGGTGFAEAIEAIPSGGPQGEYNIIPILKEDGTQRLQITDSGSFSLKVKTITQNGSYDPTDEDVNGYSSVIVAIPTYDGTVV